MPTEISDWHDLDNVRNDLAGDYVVVNDLDETTAGYDDHASSTANGGAGWDPIGADADPFTGTFDGDGHTIADVYIDRPEATTFLSLDGATISNLVLENLLYENGNDVAAALTWWVDATDPVQINNVHVKDSVIHTATSATGGLLAGGYDLTVEDCSVQDTDVLASGGDNRSGLFVGLIRDGTLIERCWSSGTLQDGDENIGGFVGRMRDSGTVRDCYTVATTVEATLNGGGFAGLVEDSTTIENCYAAVENLTVGTNEGGLIGNDADGITVTDSFWDEELSGVTTSDGGTGKTTAEMQDIDTYTDTATEGLDSPWDMVLIENHETETWAIDDGADYPVLGWEVEDVDVDIAGTVLFDDETAVEGAHMTAINTATGEVEDTATTDANGDYTLVVSPDIDAHVTFEHENETEDELYNAESKPFVDTSG